jgi:hypothetical protein
MKNRIQEDVTFIKATREEAITLANDIVGDAEVHALVIQKGFTANPEPVGYMVVQKEKSNREWVGLSMGEAKQFYDSALSRAELINAIDVFLEEKNHA